MELSRRIAIANRIKRAREQAGLTQEELGTAYRCSGAHISRIENGVAGIDIPDLERLANILGKPLEWFLSDDFEVPPRPFEAVLRELDQRYELFETTEIPVLGAVPFGYPSPEEEEAEGYISIPKAELGEAGKRVYALRAVGDCLIGDGISSGDLVIVDPDDRDILNGSIYLMRLENEVLVRHIYKQGERLRLVATNQDYEEMFPINEVEILGRVILSGIWRRH